MIQSASFNPALPTGALAWWPATRGDGTDAGWTGGKALTLWVRFKETARGKVEGDGEVMSGRGAGGRAVVRIFCREDTAGGRVGVEVWTDAREEPLELGVPRSALGGDGGNDLVLCCLGQRIELWLDGVLVDEEWPLGSLLAVTSARWAATVERAVVWNRALAEGEVRGLSGGEDGLSERETRILGMERPVGQGWKPRGFNTHVGDGMPFFHAGRLHVFYLFDRRNHRSKWGLGAHQWGHISTTNLVNWEHHPKAVEITDEGEGSICTGSVVFHGGAYHAFYSVRMADGSAAPFCLARSPDGVHFEKETPFARLTAPYRAEPARDPFVFRDEATGLFHLLATTSLVAGGGCLAQLVSRDLEHWEQREPFCVPGYPEDPECPDCFKWHGWHYLIFSIGGVAHYRMARSPLGPWQTPEEDVFSASAGKVMKTAAFTGDRRIGVAFKPGKAGEYGGGLVLREIVRRPDSTLADEDIKN